MGEELKSLYLRTEDLYNESGVNAVPAFNNTYKVELKFNPNGGNNSLLGYIRDLSLLGVGENPESLSLFCSEAVLPGSQITTQTVDGLRQGVSQHFATFRKYPDIDLTYYTQKSYYTNEVFNAWLEYISPSLESTSSGAVFDTDRTTSSYKKLRYPNSYKCEILITAFARNHLRPGEEFRRPSNDDPLSDDFMSLDRALLQIPNAIQYRLLRAFPVNIVSAPLAYGNSQLIKTTITFKYDQFFINRHVNIDDGRTDRSVGLLSAVGTSTSSGSVRSTQLRKIADKNTKPNDLAGS